MKEIILVLIIVVLFIYSSMNKKKSEDEVIKRIYQKRKTLNEEEFLKYLDSFDAKINLSKFNRLMIKVNYLEEKAKYKEASELLKEYDYSKLKNNDEIAFFSKAFEIALKLGNKDVAFNTLNHLSKINCENNEFYRLYIELKDLYDIYFMHDISLIEKYENLIKNEKNDIRKAEYYFRLAKLYHFKGDKLSVNDNLIKSKEALNSDIWTNRIDLYIKNHKMLEGYA